LFAIACAAVAMVVIAALLLFQAAEERAATKLSAQRAAAVVAQAIEREVAVTEALLASLATSPSLASDDLTAFYRQARDLAVSRGTWILLYEVDPSGRRRVLLNTALPFGVPQPPPTPETDRLAAEFVQRVATTREAQVSDVMVSSLTGQPIVAVAVPVRQHDNVHYVLAAVLPAIETSPMFTLKDLPRSWWYGVIDRDGRYVVGREPVQHDGMLPVIDAAFKRAVSAGTPAFEGLGRDGTALYVAQSRSGKTGWVSIVALPWGALVSPFHRALLVSGAAGGLLVLAVFGLTLVAESRVTLPLRRRLIADEERFRIMANTVPSILFTTDPAGRCDYVSDAFYAYTGMPVGAADGLGWVDAVHPDERQRVLDLVMGPRPAADVADAEVRPAVQQDLSEWRLIQSSDVEVRFRASDGAYRWFLIRARVVSDAVGQPSKRFGTATDIDNLKQTERALRESEREIRRISAQLMKTQDDERRRIAREIHDTTLQDLVAATLQIDQLRSPMAASGGAAEKLDDVRTLITRSQRDLRTLSYLLHPPMLDTFGLSVAIQWYARGFAKRAGIPVSVRAPEGMARLSDEVETTLFRVVQEGLTNIYRHSGSDEARIVLEQQPQSVTLEIADRGRGIDGPTRAKSATNDVALGVGIPGMRLRMQQIGGTLDIRTSARGTTLRATVPKDFRPI
jgi:signal transduction histidine kinase